MSILSKDARKKLMGYCGTSAKTPFVLTPFRSRQSTPSSPNKDFPNKDLTIKVLIVFIKYRNKDIGGAERKVLDPYLGKWVYKTIEITKPTLW